MTAICLAVCTWFAARPAPSYSRMVSIMSSMSRWTSGERISSGGTGFATWRRMGWPRRATFRIAMVSPILARGHCVSIFPTWRTPCASRRASFAVAHELEEVAVGVEEVQTVVVSPVDGRVEGDPARGKERLRGDEVRVGDLERVMRLAERVPDLVEPAGFAIGPEEERAVAVPVAEQHLIRQVHLRLHAEYLGVEALGACEVGDVHAEVVEPPHPHPASPRAIRSSAHAAARLTTMSSSSSARLSAGTARRSRRFPSTIAAFRRRPARFARHMALPRKRARNAPRSRSNSSSSGPKRSEEHTSELQSHSDLVCRLLLEKKKKNENTNKKVTEKS